VLRRNKRGHCNASRGCVTAPRASAARIHGVSNRHVASIAAACLRRVLAVLLLVLIGPCVAATPLRAGVDEAVRFDGYSPLAGTRELFARGLDPLGERRVLAMYAERHEQVPAFTVDMAQERFAVFVPATPPPPRGHGLLVYVPPWDEAVVPRRWRKVLEQTGTVFVTAARSGNAQLELPRRMALALHGYANVVAALKIDPERVHVGGFSGGARIAQLLALGFPEVFRGAILDGSSDVIGTPLSPLPTPQRLHRAQERLRLVYIHGSKDVANAEGAYRSMRSAVAWCLPQPERLVMRGRGHEPADAATLLRALRLQETPPAPQAELADCRADHEAARDADVAALEVLAATGARTDAIAALRRLDATRAHFAGAAIRRIADRLGY